MKSRAVKFVLLLFSLSLLAVCSRDAEKPLRVGSNVWIGYEPVCLTRAMGYFEGADIHLIELRSATQVMGSLRMGNLEAMYLKGKVDAVECDCRRG